MIGVVSGRLQSCANIAVFEIGIVFEIFFAVRAGG
jgi:hypothetical protein